MQFYLLRQPKADSPEDLIGRSDAHSAEACNFGEALRCPECNRFLTSLKWLPPFRVVIESWGERYGDFAEIGDDLIVSERFKQVFTSIGMQGLMSFQPVTVTKVVHHRGKPNEALPAYFKASVVRSTTSP
jgi:hypothetical protein